MDGQLKPGWVNGMMKPTAHSVTSLNRAWMVQYALFRVLQSHSLSVSHFGNEAGN